MNITPRTPDYAASHDAHMRSTYGDPWDVQPTDDPTTGDPLTGTYGRTYAESGALLMQATGDMFGPVTGHAPIMLFTVANVDQAPILHAGMGGARLTHVATFDTWDAGLRGLRVHVNAGLPALHAYLCAELAGADPHVCDYADELGLSDCRYGCKRMRCKCGETVTEHRAAYGCPDGRGQL